MQRYERKNATFRVAFFCMRSGWLDASGFWRGGIETSVIVEAHRAEAIVYNIRLVI